DGKSLRCFPTMPNILAYPGFWAREPDTGIDWKRLVHAEQEIALHAAIPASGRVVAQNRVTALWDKGPGKGALLQQRREIRDAATSTLLATVTQLSLLRGDGGFGPGGSDGAPPPPHPIPERAPDAVCDLPTLPQAALIYRLSGDLNPLHADPQVARTAGFERPILQDRKSTRLNSSHVKISYAVFCLKKKTLRGHRSSSPSDSARSST